MQIRLEKLPSADEGTTLSGVMGGDGMPIYHSQYRTHFRVRSGGLGVQTANYDTL